METKRKYSKQELKEIAQKIVSKYKVYHDKDDGVYLEIKKENMYSLKPGQFATIRSCLDEDGEDIHLAVFVGTIDQFFGDHPVFYVFGLKKLLRGCESWWQPIKTNDLKLGCSGMKEKNSFTWEDVEEKLVEGIKEFNERMEKKSKKK